MKKVCTEGTSKETTNLIIIGGRKDIEKDLLLKIIERQGNTPTLVMGNDLGWDLSGVASRTGRTLSVIQEGFNPVRCVEDREDAKVVAKVLLGEMLNKEEFFAQAEEELLTDLILHLATDKCHAFDKSPVGVLALLNKIGEASMMGDLSSIDKWFDLGESGIDRLPPKTRDAVIMTVSFALQPLAFLTYDHLEKGWEMEENAIVYAPIIPIDGAVKNKLFAAAVMLLYRKWERKHEGEPALFVLDEVPNLLIPGEWLKDRMYRTRNNNIEFAISAMDVVQLKQAMPDEWDRVISYCGERMILRNGNEITGQWVFKETGGGTQKVLPLDRASEPEQPPLDARSIRDLKDDEVVIMDNRGGYTIEQIPSS